MTAGLISRASASRSRRIRSASGVRACCLHLTLSHFICHAVYSLCQWMARVPQSSAAAADDCLLSPRVVAQQQRRAFSRFCLLPRHLSPPPAASRHSALFSSLASDTAGATHARSCFARGLGYRRAPLLCLHRERTSCASCARPAACSCADTSTSVHRCRGLIVSVRLLRRETGGQ